MKVILSIKPEYAERILSGEKNLNLGKAFLKTKMLILSSFMRLCPWVK